MATGTINRAGRVEDGTTVTDFDEAEQRQQRSVSLALAPLEHDGRQGQPARHPRLRRLRRRPARRPARRRRRPVRRLGRRRRRRRHPDALGGVRRRRHAARRRRHQARPPARRLRRDGRRSASASSATACCRSTCRWPPTTARPAGLIGLLSQRVFDYSGGTRTERDPDAEHLPLIEAARNALIEGIIAESEDETPDGPLPRRRGHRRRRAHRRPREGGRARLVLPGARRSPRRPGSAWPSCSRSSPRGFPSPLEHPRAAGHRPGRRRRAARSPATRTARWSPRSSRPRPTRTSAGSPWSGCSPARCARTPSCTCPATSGRSSATTAATRTTTSTSGSARCPRRWARRSARSAQAIAGDIVAVAKLTRAETGDTLSDKDDPLLMEPWVMPDPLLPVAIVAHAKADEDKLSQGLQRLVAEDPTMRLENNPETHQLVLWCMGEAHVDVLLDRLRNRYGVAVDSVPLRVSLRETFAGPSKGHGRHVKQSGGHGQFAVCDIEVEPLPHGQRLRVRRQGRRRRGAAPVHPVGREGRARPDGARRRRRLPGGRHPRHPGRRQGALGRLLGHGVPDRRRARAARRPRAPARCSMLEPVDEVDRAGRRRVRRRGHERPVRPARPGRRHRAGRRRPHAGPRRGAAARDHAVRRRPAVAVARHGHVHAGVPAARADARRSSRRRSRPTQPAAG